LKVAIIDYGSGNLHSVQKAIEKASINVHNARAEVTSDPEKILSADRIVLPGVGAFGDCKKGLLEIPGLVDALSEAVLERGRPFLGICVGMQLLATTGLEYERTDGLNWISGMVKPLEPADSSLRIPQMGWNTLSVIHHHDLLDGLSLGEEGLHAYFVHSYFFSCDNSNDVVAVTEYGGPVTAVIARDNIAGSQFHPEKSQKLGIAFLENFLRWKP
jgi:imidazole glycerol-phosphate synthase subunit HisH